MERELEDRVLDKVFLDGLIESIKLTDLERECIEYLRQGYTLSDWAKMTSRDSEKMQFVYRRIRKKFRGGKEPEPFDKYERARELRDKGLTYQMIADRLGLKALHQAVDYVKVARARKGLPTSDGFSRSKYIFKHKKENKKPYYCAICGARTLHPKYRLCTSCYEKYGITEPWVKALILYENSIYNKIYSTNESSFTDENLDVNGEPILER